MTNTAKQVTDYGIQALKTHCGKKAWKSACFDFSRYIDMLATSDKSPREIHRSIGMAIDTALRNKVRSIGWFRKLHTLNTEAIREIWF